MRLTLLIVGCFFSAYTSAAIYKCTDANGNTEYRSSPCETGRKNVELNVKTGASTNLDDKENQQALEQKEKQAALEKLELEQEALLKKQENTNREAMNESAKNQFLIKNNADKYSAYAIAPYITDKLPDLVKPYQARLPDIERFRRQSAEKALASNQCIRVESVELNSKSTQDALIFLVNCSSGKSFYFSEHELINVAP
jgi:CHAT domain-containing protein